MRTVKVYEVVYNCGHDGRMGDGIGIYRTRNERDAEFFAQGKTCYAGPATVEVCNVPLAFAKRWGV